MEPENSKVILALGRLYIKNKECDKAKDLVISNKKSEQQQLIIKRIAVIDSLSDLYVESLKCLKKNKEIEDFQKIK